MSLEDVLLIPIRIKVRMISSLKLPLNHGNHHLLSIFLGGFEVSNDKPL